MRIIVYSMAFLIGFLPLVFAGWNTDLFDGESKRWGYGYERAQQCYSAVVERVRACGGEDWDMWLDIKPRRWGSSWTLEEAKSIIWSELSTSGLGRWVDMHKMTDGTFDGWFEGKDPYYQHELPYLNRINILEYAGAPTNWFSETPHWGAVTHSNGWKYLDDVLNEMVALQCDCSSLTNEKWVIPGELSYSIEGRGTSRAEAIANAESNYSSGEWVAQDPYDFDYFWEIDQNIDYYDDPPYGDENSYLAYITEARWRLSVSNDLPHACDWSGYVIALYGGKNFDDFGTDVPTNTVEFWTATLSSGEETTTSWIDPNMPGTWPDGHGVSGYMFGEPYDYTPIELWRFDVPNGFEYVE